jgi:hypothetical protein
VTPPVLADADALAARFASRIASALNERADSLPHDITERLRLSREQALARRRAAARAVVPLAQRVLVAAAAGRPPAARPTWWLRLASVLPLAVLAAGLVLLDRWSTRSQVEAAAEVDAVVLADDLPPAAYTDPAFAEYLKSAP